MIDRINSMLYERTAISKRPELTIINDLKQLSEKSGIHVAQCLTQLPPKELFQEKLHKAIERAKDIFSAKELE